MHHLKSFYTEKERFIYEKSYSDASKRFRMREVEVRKLVIDDIMAALARKVNKTPLKMKKDVGLKEAPYYWNGYNDGLKDAVWFIDAKFNGNEKVMPCKCECHKEKEGVCTVGTESMKIISSYCSLCIDKHSVNKTI